MAIASSFASLRPSLLLDFANSKAVDPRITFSRSTTGKFYDGVTTAKAEENLLRYSQEFDNAVWTKSNATVTANAATAPDGTTTAEELVEDSSTSAHGLYQLPATAGTQTFSAFLKQNTRSWGALRVDGVSTFFDLATGVVGTVGAGCTAVITSVGGGWYRCAVTKTWGSVQNAWIRIATADTVESYTGDGTSGIYIWGAQLEQRSAVTAYTPTTTQPITNYIPVLQTAAAGVPRIDHNPVTGECLGLLIEEQRTNLLTYSEDFGNAYWTASNSSLESNTVVAPDGTLTGDKLVENTAASVNHKIESTGVTGLVSGASYTFSVYIKPAGQNWALIEMQAALGGGYAWFDLSNGTVGTQVNLSGTSTITPVGNGWYRCSITDTATGTGNSISKCAIFSANANNVTAYTGDGYSGIFIWGAQLEAGAFPTSQITTVATQETRNADAASMTGTNFSSWFNNGEGTLYGEAKAFFIPAANAFGVVTARTGSTNAIGIGIAPDTGATSNIVRTNDVGQVAFNAAMTNNVYHKVSMSYATNDFVFSVDGGAAQVDTSGILPVVDSLVIGQNRAGSVAGAEHIKKISYYPQALTAANLQALTA